MPISTPATCRPVWAGLEITMQVGRTGGALWDILCEDAIPGNRTSTPSYSRLPLIHHWQDDGLRFPDTPNRS